MREARWAPPPVAQVAALLEGRAKGGKWDVGQDTLIVKVNAQNSEVGISRDLEHCRRIEYGMLNGRIALVADMVTARSSVNVRAD
eukprot:1484187-Amphidinium_carterae.1